MWSLPEYQRARYSDTIREPLWRQRYQVAIHIQYVSINIEHEIPARYQYQDIQVHDVHTHAWHAGTNLASPSELQRWIERNRTTYIIAHHDNLNWMDVPKVSYVITILWVLSLQRHVMLHHWYFGALSKVLGPVWTCLRLKEERKTSNAWHLEEMNPKTKWQQRFWTVEL